MQRALWAVILLATGCDRLLGLDHQDPVTPGTPDAPRPPALLVQQQTASNASAWTLTATLAAPPTSGNVLVMIGATDRSTLIPPTGGGVATWAMAASSFQNADIEIWYGMSDGSSSTVTITCACSSTTLGNMRLSLTEWSGLATGNLFETAGQASGTGNPGTATPGTLTTLDGPDLLVFGVSIYGTLGADVMDVDTWIPLDAITVGSEAQSQWYQLPAGPGSYTPSVTVNGDWDAAIAAFRTQP